MGEAIHILIPFLIAVVALVTRRATRRKYWTLVCVLLAASLPLAFVGGQASASLWGWALMFGLPMSVAAWVGESARSWRRPTIALAVVPLVYLGTLLLTLSVGVNAGVLSP
jgi:hypothetical protein